MRKKGFALPLILILIILGFGIIGTLYIFLKANKKTQLVPSNNSQISSKQQSLKGVSFTDDQGVITFNYPAGATEIHSESPTPIGGISFQAWYKTWGELGSWSITIVAVPDERNWEKFRSEIINIELVENNTFAFSNIEEISFAGQRAITYKRFPKKTEAVQSRFIETLHEGLHYSIGIGAKEEQTREQPEEAYNLMLTSFRFLK